ncbi:MULTISPECIES: hypothetical protein [unclassified Tolypothrix]|uniref:hypothetical protein n=1 Tax=unclassified Tolypothrix TaxID=2649714 RepID=UPI0005EAB5B4|nr:MULTISPECIES: hypothetical protein [unclassified Tolypothrix]BAY95236.1 TPR domain protein [Microchaete diplosiphon NIES-3275]EKE98144.1 hypothetical protein FDUTEX481_04292 [Tolypothrix sp. PCC 7601]MBE9086013.1 hypothetical protein [Tolypothrix sp. LEGE 11397]UYD30465.1 hypothetical protein HGR01_37130 [Tolypothrix sp. PCC 7712]UYD38401.1 hypothetical protein HG267_37765 [Tolypothrix sp. PCC 7601]
MTSNSQTPGQLLFAKLEINLDEIPIEQLADYTAVEYYLTVEDEPPPNATNLEKVRHYLEAFHHLCEVKDWNSAKTILLDRQIGSQLQTWSKYREMMNCYQRLIGHLNALDEVTCNRGLGNAYFFLCIYPSFVTLGRGKVEIRVNQGYKN